MIRVLLVLLIVYSAAVAVAATTSAPVNVPIIITSPGAAEPSGITITPASAIVPDTATAGTLLASVTVAMSDGSTFVGTLTASNTDLVAFSGLSVVLARNLRPTDDGFYNVTIVPQ